MAIHHFMSNRSRERVIIVLTTTAVIAAVVLCSFFFLKPTAVIIENKKMDDLIPQVSKQDESSHETRIDWSSLDNIDNYNKDVVGWISVENTPINLPVCHRDTGGSYYLSHDIQGNKSMIGIPYIDDRSSLNVLHTLIYGHHITGSTAAFSPLQTCYEQTSFSHLGMLNIYEKTGSVIQAQPLMSMRVDEHYQPIQNYEFLTSDELQAWLNSIKRDATAISPDLDRQIHSANHVFTLVTCSSDQAGQADRTLVLFTTN